MGLGTPKSRWIHDPDFGEYDPDPKLATFEENGSTFWQGGHLDYIQAKHEEIQSAFPQELNSFLEHIWKGGVVNHAAPQTNIIGSHRGPAKPSSAIPHNRIPNPSPLPPHAKDPDDPILTAENKSKFGHLDGIAKDWKTMSDLKVVNAFTFRGEKDKSGVRCPEKVKLVGGFRPNSTRNDDYYLSPPNGPVFVAFADYMKRRYGKAISETDYTEAILKRSKQFKQLFMEYSIWRELMKGEELHLGRMLANEVLKGYISTTKSVYIAKGFAGDPGWVYCVLVRGGYEVPDKGQTYWNKIFGEQEIAFPGSIPWKDVYGFRATTKDSRFHGPIWLRSGSGYWSPNVREKVYKLFSGQVQK